VTRSRKSAHSVELSVPAEDCRLLFVLDARERLVVVPDGFLALAEAERQEHLPLVPVVAVLDGHRQRPAVDVGRRRGPRRGRTSGHHQHHREDGAPQYVSVHSRSPVLTAA